MLQSALPLEFQENSPGFVEGEESIVLLPFSILPDNTWYLVGLFGHRPIVLKWQRVLDKTLFWIISLH